MGDDDYGPQPQKQKAAKKWTVEQTEKFDGNRDALVLPGVVADRKTKQVRVFSEITGAGSQDSIEFLILGTESSHGYEALMWSHAEPSAIHAALEFIGLSPGGARNPGELRFWSKGRNILVSVEIEEDVPPVPLEELIYNQTEDQPIPKEGFLFTGSKRVQKPDGSGELGYAAELYPPHSILSAFNDPGAVLDVGWQINKQEAYTSYTSNPEFRLVGHQTCILLIEPANKDGESRIRNLKLTVHDRETFSLKHLESDEPVTGKTGISEVLEACRQMVEEGLEPYVTLVFDDAMTLGQIRPICRGMGTLDRADALRIEPPKSGRLYYRSFVPNEEWRKPVKRKTQAWEIHIKKEQARLRATMLFNDPEWEGDSLEPEFTVRKESADTPQAVRDILDADKARRKAADKRALPPVLLVFADPNLPYGNLLEFLAPALETHNTVHLFLQERN